MSTAAPKRYTVRLLAALAAVLLFECILNTTVNPLRVTSVPWSLDVFEPYRVVEHYERTAKAGYVRSSDWNAAILGSSRMDISINPDDPAFVGVRAVNLALPGGKLAENIAMLRYTMAREEVSLVVFGIDLVDLAVPPAPPRSDFHSSPLAPGGGVDRELQYLLGIPFLKQSLTVAGRTLRGEPAEHAANGYWARPKPAKGQRRDAERGSLGQVFGFYRARTSGVRIHPAKAAMLEEIVALVRAKGARLILVLPPNHAVFNAGLHLLGDPDPVLRNERAFIAGLIAADNARNPSGPASAVWDFDDFHPVNCEPIPADRETTMSYWLDITHCTAKTGSLMAAAFMETSTAQPEDKDYGYLLTPASVDARAESIRAGYERYARENPSEIEWTRVALKKLQAAASDLIATED